MRPIEWAWLALCLPLTAHCSPLNLNQASQSCGPSGCSTGHDKPPYINTYHNPGCKDGDAIQAETTFQQAGVCHPWSMTSTNVGIFWGDGGDVANELELFTDDACSVSPNISDWRNSMGPDYGGTYIHKWSANSVTFDCYDGHSQLYSFGPPPEGQWRSMRLGRWNTAGSHGVPH